MTRPSRWWLAVAGGCALTGAAGAVALTASIESYPLRYDPVALAGAALIGMVIGLIVAAFAGHVVDVADAVDRYTGRRRHPEWLDLDDVLRITCRGPVGTGLTDVADAAGVTPERAR